jgi:aminopeptidase N
VPWPLPFRAALVDEQGNDLAETMVRLDGPEAEIRFEEVEQPAFLSLNREYSFYGKVRTCTDPVALRLQAVHDRDAVNRFIALYRLAEQEIIRLIDHPGQEPSDEYLDLYFRILGDEDRSREMGGLFDTVDDPEYAHRYRALYEARRRIESSIASRHGADLRNMYDRHNHAVPLTAPMEVQVPAIKERQLKNICLALVATLDTPDIHTAIRSQLGTGSVATDRLRAFSLYLHSTAPDRLAVMESVGNEAAGHPVSWEAYLAAVGGCSAPDAVALIRRAGKSPSFRMNQVNDHRALYGSFAANRKVSLQTREGRELLGEILIALAPVNQNSVVSMLRAFGAIDLMEEEYHVPLIGLLVTVRDRLDPEQHAVVHHTIRRLLIGAPVAVRAYEAMHGPLAGVS